MGIYTMTNGEKNDIDHKNWIDQKEKTSVWMFLEVVNSMDNTDMGKADNKGKDIHNHSHSHNQELIKHLPQGLPRSQLQTESQNLVLRNQSLVPRIQKDV